jgi:hypothetical protein
MTVGIVHSEESITYLAGDPDAPDRGFAGASGLTFSGRVETSAETCIRCAAVTHSPPENLVETVTFQTTRTFPTRQQAEAYAKTWSPPPPRVPREVPNWRMKAILTRIGMLDAARSALESLPPQAKDVALLAWDGDAHFSRRSPSVEFIARALRISALELDEIFIAAGNLEV